MIETIQTVSELSPIAAIVILAGVAATILTQIAKRPGWTAARSQTVALAVSVVLGLVAYVVSGVATVFPDSFVDVVSTAVVVIAGVALMSRAAYALLGRAVPDGRETLPAEQGADGVYNVMVEGLSADEVSEEIERQQKRRQLLAGEGRDDADA
jgi:multisubunit Na+/H+ antiporter MnhB subunit